MLDLLMFVGLGVFAGIASGLLGGGSGAIVVPILMIIFIGMKMPAAVLMQLAAGTSLCIMVVSSAASAFEHQRRHNIIWPIFIRMIPFMLLGTLLGAVVAKYLPSEFLSWLFALFLLALGVRMLRRTKPKPGLLRPPKKQIVRLAGLLIGCNSGLLGVGSGILSVPFLVWSNIPMRQASGTSVAFTLPVAFLGSVAFMLLGVGAVPNVNWTTGFVYWPAVLCVAPFSVIAAKLGAKWTQFLSTKLLQRIFAVLLLLLAVKMLF